MFLVVLLYALFASVFTIAKVGLEYSQPIFFVGARMSVAGILMLGYQYIFNPQEFTFKKENLWRLLQLAAFNIYLTNIFEFWGLKYLTSAKTCFIYSISPFVSAFISYLVFSEKMTPKKWIGLTIGFLGLIPILLQDSAEEAMTGQFFFLSFAEIAVIMAAICSVYGWILLRLLVREGGYSPLTANGMSMVVGGAMSLIHSYFVEPWDPVPVTEFMPFAISAVLLIIISNMICYNLYGYLLRRFSATFMSFAGFTTPLFSAFFGWIYLGETVSWPFYLSLTIVFFGLLVFYMEELKKEYKAPASA